MAEVKASAEQSSGDATAQETKTSLSNGSWVQKDQCVGEKADLGSLPERTIEQVVYTLVSRATSLVAKPWGFLCICFIFLVHLFSNAQPKSGKPRSYSWDGK